jgi:hypothetical protein
MFHRQAKVPRISCIYPSASHSDGLIMSCTRRFSICSSSTRQVVSRKHIGGGPVGRFTLIHSSAMKIDFCIWETLTWLLNPYPAKTSTSSYVGTTAQSQPQPQPPQTQLDHGHVSEYHLRSDQISPPHTIERTIRSKSHRSLRPVHHQHRGAGYKQFQTAIGFGHFTPAATRPKCRRKALGLTLKMAMGIGLCKYASGNPRA